MRREQRAAGKLIAGKYRLKHPLSSGGMASLWVAHNEALDIDVALKWILPELSDEEEARLAERMLNEARAAARLNHPAIVRILDFSETDFGEPFIVMELLAGEDLASALQRRGRVSAVKALKILLPIAHALASAHEHGIVHRDVKPENIFLPKSRTGTMQPKLIDFGVAKLDAKIEERITNVGAIVGSPHYLSPEQARGDDADHRADIWSFCVVLYEMITGRRPFEAKNARALLRAIVEDQAVPITYFGAGDEALWAIIERGVAKDPEVRWSSMRGIGEAFADWLITRQVLEDVCGASLQVVWMDSVASRAAFSSVPPPSPEHQTRRSFVEGDTLVPSSQQWSGPEGTPISQERPSDTGQWRDSWLPPESDAEPSGEARERRSDSSKRRSDPSKRRSDPSKRRRNSSRDSRPRSDTPRPRSDTPRPRFATPLQGSLTVSPELVHGTAAPDSDTPTASVPSAVSSSSAATSSPITAPSAGTEPAATEDSLADSAADLASRLPGRSSPQVTLALWQLLLAALLVAAFSSFTTWWLMRTSSIRATPSSTPPTQHC